MAALGDSTFEHNGIIRIHAHDHFLGNTIGSGLVLLLFQLEVLSEVVDVRELRVGIVEVVEVPVAVLQSLFDEVVALLVRLRYVALF